MTEPTTPPPSPSETAPSSEELTKDIKTMAMAAHLLGIVGFIGPLIIWLVKKDESEFVSDQAKEALNWEITMLIGYVVASVTTFAIIGCVLMPAVIIVDLIFNIIGGMKANEGVRYRYPFAIRLIK